MKPESFQGAFSDRFVTQAIGGVGNLAPDDALGFTEIVTDSRKITPGCLFVALVGEKFDGHAFIEGAVSAGARGVVCRTGSIVPPGAKGYLVKDTQEAFRSLGAAWRRRFKIPVIAVAGSVGKTTTKEILAALLRGRWKNTWRTEGSQNGFVGIPMTLLALRSEHEAAVIEVGIDAIGAMKSHMELIHPDAGLLTTIGPEHLEFLKDVPTVAREESIALRSIDSTGGAVAINLDDPWVRPLASDLSGKGPRIHYSLDGAESPSPRAWMLRGELATDGANLKLRESSPHGSTPVEYELKLPIPGKHNALNLLGAVAIARAVGLSPEELRSGLSTFGGASGRSEVRRAGTGNTVICDYYNASPPSTVAGLDLLSQLGRGKKLWACLGDMLELGDGEEAFHRELAGSIARAGVAEVLLYGPRMKWLRDELETARSRGEFKGHARHFESHDAIAKALLDERGGDDVILIKGSRGMRMEEVWKRIEKASGRPAS